MKEADNMLRDSVNEISAVRDSIQVVDGFDPKLYQRTQPPYVSIYLPVAHEHRQRRRDDWTADEFKDLCKEALRRLAESHDDGAFAGIREHVDYLQDHPDDPVWLNAGKGLAFLMSNAGVQVFNLEFEPPATVTVGDEYYIKPLLRQQACHASYYLLLLNSDRFGLLHGDENGVTYLPLLPSVHKEFAEEFATYDGTEAALDYYSLEGHMSPYHDHKSRKEVAKEEAEKFFRSVDKFMSGTVVKADSTPVILVTLPEHAAMFRRICTFGTLLPEGIEKDARTLSGDQLRDGAMAIMNGRRKATLEKLTERYQLDASKGRASDDLAKIGFALAERNVEALFVEQGKGLPGTFDATTGAVEYDPSRNPADAKEIDPADPDIADAMVQAALKQDATIYVLAAEEMPTRNGIAALFRHE